MKSAIGAVGAFLTGAAVSVAAIDTGQRPDSGWHLAYEQNAAGAASAGSKEELISAVREGQPVRIYWSRGRVEHSTAAAFLTVFQGEVFAQTAIFRRQRPGIDPIRIDLTEDGSTWSGVFATNNERHIKWYVKRD